MNLSTRGLLSAQLTDKYVLSRISEIDIFKYYITNFKTINKPFSSELRIDKKPSCVIFSSINGYKYHDISKKIILNCFQYVQEKFNVDYNKALTIIANDFNLSKTMVSYDINKVLNYDNKIKETFIRIKSREWNVEDIEYWNQYNINLSILNHFNVKPISHYWIKEYLFETKDLSYAYCFGNYKYKIYRPYNDQYKWVNNSNDIIQGYKELITRGDLLVITKSMKDVMSLYSLGYNAIALGGESYKLDQDTISILKSRFPRIIIFYDNDTTGITYANSLSKDLDCSCIFIDPGYEEKDISDFISTYGVEDAKKLLKDYCG